MFHKLVMTFWSVQFFSRRSASTGQINNVPLELRKPVELIGKTQRPARTETLANRTTTSDCEQKEAEIPHKRQENKQQAPAKKPPRKIELRPSFTDRSQLPQFEPAKRKDLIALVACALGLIFASPARKNNRVCCWI